MDGGFALFTKIFVYHSESDHESQKSVFKTMESFIVYNDARYVTIMGFGLLLIHSLGFTIFQNYGCR